MARILVVENDAAVLDALAATLSDEGYDVERAATAGEARQKIEAPGNEYDVIVTDMRMEEEDSGVKVVQAAREKAPLTPVIVLTGYAGIDDAIQSMRAGAFSYLAKRGEEGEADLLVMHVARAMSLRLTSSPFYNSLDKVLELLGDAQSKVDLARAELKAVADLRQRLAKGSNNLPDYSKDPRVTGLARDIEAIRNDLHNVEFFLPGATVEDAELQVLRRWSSHTPVLNFSHGGGYLLRWRDKGTVIDPGVTFLDVFQRPHPVERMKPHHMDDIDLVLVTHDHADHCEDLGMLLVFLRNYNEWRWDTSRLAPHKIDFVQSIGAHFRSVILLDNAENRRFVRAIDVPPPRRKRNSHYPLRLPTDCRMKLEELCAEHTEVLGDRSALGFRIKLQKRGGGEFVYCDTGDTKYDLELAKQYRGADLLLLHVGTMEDVKKEPAGRGEHLCFYGVVEILKDLEKQKDGRLKLVLLGEWGEEFRGPGYRQRFAELAKDAAKYCGPVLPVDLGMRIRLDDCCRVMCRKGNADQPTAPQDVVVVDWGQWIEYHAR